MDYEEHKKYFETAYRTGTDAWTMPTSPKQVAKLTEKIAKGGLILDIGSGRGLLGKHLAQIGFRVIGIDFEGNIVENANKNIKDWGLLGKLKFMKGSALDIPFADASFDGACDIGTFENLYKEDWPTYVNEVNRILKPGGFYLNVSLSNKTENFFEFSPANSTNRDFEKYGVHYHFFEGIEMKNIFNGRLEVVSQNVLPSKTQGVFLLETLFQKK